jgi:hypothetical protein
MPLLDKPCKSMPAKDLEDRIMNPNIAKSEAEWWAKNKIEELQWIIKRYVNGTCKWIYNDGTECWESSCGLDEMIDPRTFDLKKFPRCPACGLIIKLEPKDRT